MNAGGNLRATMVPCCPAFSSATGLRAAAEPHRSWHSGQTFLLGAGPSKREIFASEYLFKEVCHACCPRLRFPLVVAARSWAPMGRATHVALSSTAAAPDGHTHDRATTSKYRHNDPW